MSNSTTTSVERTNPSRVGRIGLAGAAAAAILAAVILAGGAGAAPSGTLAAADGAASSLVNAVQASAGTPNRPSPGDFRGGHRDGMGGFGAITISAISGSNISLRTDDGWTRTITVDDGTAVQVNGTAAKLGDLKVGDEIRFHQTRESNGTFTIDAIAVIPPHAGGQVSSVDGTTISVTTRDGATVKIKVASGTTYEVNGATGALSDIKTGMVLMASGTRDASGTLTATQVRAGDPGRMGPGRHGFPGDRDGAPNGGPNAGSIPDAPAGGSNG